MAHCGARKASSVDGKRASIRGKRDYATLAISLGCGLRRGELTAWRVEDIQQREEHRALIGIMDRPTTTISTPSVMVKNSRLQGVSHGSRDDMEEMLAFVEKSRISPIIDARYCFNALPDALDHLVRGPFGKVLVEIN